MHPPAPSPADDAPAVTFWGAAQSVSGSQHLLQTPAGLILLDCGMLQGRRDEAERRNASFPFRVDKLRAVVLSHAHVDHCGNVPTLVRQGYRGPIYCTPLTADLAAVMLADAAKVQEEEAAYANLRRRGSGSWVDPLFTTADTARAVGRFRPVAYGEPIELADGVTATLTDAGHVPGSAVTHVRIETSRHRYSLTYTGDLGRPGFGILPPPAALPPAGVVICESTYGGRRHPDLATCRAELAAAVARVDETGGKLIIPAFGFGRTQTVVHFLLEVMRAGAAPHLPIYVDSPLAAAIANVFRAHPDAFLVDLPGDQSAVRYVASFPESLALIDKRGPHVVVAAGGMADGGRITGHLAKAVAKPANVIALVSFQAPRSLGRQLLDRPATVTIQGKDHPLRADVRHLEGYSSHADHDDLLAALLPLLPRQPRVRLVHGEKAAAEQLAADLAGRGFADVAVPAAGDTLELPPDP